MPGAPISSFQQMQQMGPSGGGGEGFPTVQVLLGKGLGEAGGFVAKDRDYGQGFSLQSLGGFGEMLSAARKGSIFAILFRDIGDTGEKFMGSFGAGDIDMSGGGGEGGGSDNASAFSILSGMPNLGEAQDVSMAQLGSFNPDPTPGMGAARGANIGFDAGR